MIEPNRITTESKIDLIFYLKWKSEFATHTDGFQASRVNMWRDLFPSDLLDELLGKEAGDRFQIPLKAGNAFSSYNDSDLVTIESSQFDRRFRQGVLTEPRMGRFYPKGMLKGFPGIYRVNMTPFRCVGVNNGHMKVDFNHPLAVRDLQLSVIVGKVGTVESERGGTSNDWLEVVTTGPGMQARWQEHGTDYFSDGNFSRKDEQNDSVFYQKPRFVHHIDDTAREMVRNTYGRFLTEGMDILDLMSSWESHLPKSSNYRLVTGLGLNPDELKKNRQLSDYVVQDLNVDAALPFEPNSFDAVINTVSVEYLIDPLTVFREVERVLRPDGYFIITFSNRWFPTKAIKLWSELHEFERMGLVLEYFLRSGGFKDLQTYSIRGLPRPHDDSYFPELLFSDPVYAVWGRKK